MWVSGCWRPTRISPPGEIQSSQGRSPTIFLVEHLYQEFGCAARWQREPLPVDNFVIISRRDLRFGMLIDLKITRTLTNRIFEFRIRDPPTPLFVLKFD